MRQAPQQPGSAANSRGTLRRALAKVGFALVGALALFVLTGSGSASAACPNEELRTGPSAHLPDCRAYELVTPPNINGGTPEAGARGGQAYDRFTSSSVFNQGNTYVWTLTDAGVPGTESTGLANVYRADRSANGWVNSRMGPSVLESSKTDPGSPSADLGYLPFIARAKGSLILCPGCEPRYIEYPDGSFHLAGEGTIPTATDTDGYPNGFIDDLEPRIEWVSPGGGHQIILTRVRLNEESPVPPPNWDGIYDRTPQGLKLVSKLPNNEAAMGIVGFVGCSADGSTVMFSFEGNLYARVDNERTVLLAKGEEGVALSAGVNADGSRAFYLQNGKIFGYDFTTEEALSVTEAGDAIPVTVSPDGSHVYFLTETELISGKGVVGQPNLYVWDGSAVKFIATVSPADIVWEDGLGSGLKYGLGIWSAVFKSVELPAENDYRGMNTTRTTPDGRVIVFESSAEIETSPGVKFNNEGHFEIYRYDTVTEELDCVSCSRVESSSTADSFLDFKGPGFSYQLVDPMNVVQNLSQDGNQVVFETADRLLPADTNGVRDVYEWRDGQLSLISTGESEQSSLLMGVSPEGNDIFFRTGQPLVGQGQEPGATSIYDARVGGGLASQLATAPAAECLGEGCLQESGANLAPLSPASSQFHGHGNVKPACRGHRKRHAGKARTSAKHKHKHKHKHKCGHHKRGAGK